MLTRDSYEIEVGPVCEGQTLKIYQPVVEWRLPSSVAVKAQLLRNDRVVATSDDGYISSLKGDSDTITSLNRYSEARFEMAFVFDIAPSPRTRFTVRYVGFMDGEWRPVSLEIPYMDTTGATC